MNTTATVGLVVPRARDEVPPEGPQMYPGIRFVARGVGVKALTPEGFDDAWNAIEPAAQQLAETGVDAVMLMGTSLTFYRGREMHDKLVERVRAATRLPVSTMSTAVVEGLRRLDARRIGVCTAYADEVNARLRDFLVAEGFEVLALSAFGLEDFGAPSRKGEADILALATETAAAAPEADAMLVACGGLRMLETGKQIEQRHGIPVVASTPAAFWAAARLVGHSGAIPGQGRLFE